MASALRVLILIAVVFTASTATLTPALESCDGKENLAVNGEVTASSEYNKGLNIGYGKAANGFAGPLKEWHSAEGMPQSITYKLKEKAAVCKITFLSRSNDEAGNLRRDCPSDFGIEGSYDGSSFILLKRVVGLGVCKKGQIIETVLNNCAEYLYYRIMVESVRGRGNGAKFVVLRDIKMFGTSKETKEITYKSNDTPYGKNYTVKYQLLPCAPQ